MRTSLKDFYACSYTTKECGNGTADDVDPYGIIHGSQSKLPIGYQQLRRNKIAVKRMTNFNSTRDLRYP